MPKTALNGEGHFFVAGDSSNAVYVFKPTSLQKVIEEYLAEGMDLEAIEELEKPEHANNPVKKKLQKMVYKEADQRLDSDWRER